METGNKTVILLATNWSNLQILRNAGTVSVSNRDSSVELEIERA